MKALQTEKAEEKEIKEAYAAKRSETIANMKRLPYKLECQNFGKTIIETCLLVDYGISVDYVLTAKRLNNGAWHVKYRIKGKTASLFISHLLLVRQKMQANSDSSQMVKVSKDSIRGTHQYWYTTTESDTYRTSLTQCNCFVHSDGKNHAMRVNGKTVCKHQLAVAREKFGCHSISRYLEEIKKHRSVVR